MGVKALPVRLTALRIFAGCANSDRPRFPGKLGPVGSSRQLGG